MKEFTAYVTWPSDHISGLVEAALEDIGAPVSVSKTTPDEDADPGLLLQWSTYDSLVHTLTLQHPSKVLSSSYTIRKALIRKHFLHRTITNYLTKAPTAGSVLHKAVPQTWPIEISFADELDDLWADELWDLATELEKEEKWFILKPGMADRGQGIRMFNSRESLYSIFESFEDESSDEEREDSESASQEEVKSGTAVMTSQLRHFVIQEYLSSPLLVDPRQAHVGPQLLPDEPLQGRKFHLRVYCVAFGALQLFMSRNILALFAGTPYTTPSLESTSDPNAMDLSSHLTNTALQTDVHESSIRLLGELIGCSILSGSNVDDALSSNDVQAIEDQVSDILAETFKAALASAIHFQTLPNAFELFGVDMLVTHTSQPSKFQVHLLEVNAEPAIELTGARLNWILVDLFKGIAHTCVKPFFEEGQESTRESNQWLRKCLDVEARRFA